jgi:hypothetical protein
MINHELVAELGNRHHEDEVEKEFEPGCMPPVDLAAASAQLRRPQPESVAVHGR